MGIRQQVLLYLALLALLLALYVGAARVYAKAPICAAADVSGDGRVTLVDVMYVNRKAPNVLPFVLSVWQSGDCA